MIDVFSDPMAVAHTLLHEIGHVLYFLMDQKTGGVWTDKEDVPGTVAQVYEHHFGSLNLKGRASLARHSTLYGGSADSESFAENFAIYFLGKNKIELPTGLVSFVGGIAVGFDQLYEEFRTKDPVGFLLMSRLEQCFIAPSGTYEREHPEVAYSWSSYEKARRFEQHFLIDVHGLNPDLERKWLQVPHYRADYEVEELYESFRNNPPSDQFERIQRLGVLYRLTGGQLYPVFRDCLCGMIRASMEAHSGVEVKVSLGELLKAFGTQLLLNSHDPELQETLLWLVEFDPTQPQSQYNAESFRDPAIIELIGQIARELVLDVRRTEFAVTAYAFSLKQRGRYGEAIEYFTRSLHLNDEYNFRIGSQLQIAVCQERLGHTDEAIRIYRAVLDPYLEESRKVYGIERARGGLARIFEAGGRYGELIIWLKTLSPSHLGTISLVLRDKTFDMMRSQFPEEMARLVDTIRREIKRLEPFGALSKGKIEELRRKYKIN